ncbi:MAG: nucleoside-diphosphate kinase [Clostridia bacterium]|nr:MAG: nucleoside-diphosphate kinase [Clostridia bacterium]
MERTLVLVKPDGVQRGLVGEIIGRLEKKGYRLVGLKLLQMSRELAEEHYAEHQGKGFFPGLVEYITSAPLVAMVWEGKGVIQGVRRLMGATNPAEAGPGTIRGDLAIETGRNLVHGSDSEASAAREIELFFRAKEMVTYSRAGEDWLYE